MICPNCGGDFADWASKCPYCGNMNYQGAEKQYLDQLETLRQDMEELPEVSKEHYRRGIGGVVKRMFWPLLVLILAAVAIAALGMLWEQYQEKKYEDRYLRTYAWEKENFPQLNQWYEAGEYDKIVEFSDRLLEEDSEFQLNNWEHTVFVTDYYKPYGDCLLLRRTLEEGEIPSWEMVMDALPAGIFLGFYTTEERLEEKKEEMEKWGYGLTGDEVLKVKEYCLAARAVLYENMGFTEEEARALSLECTDEDGYMRYVPCYDYVDLVMERMGWDK